MLGIIAAAVTVILVLLQVGVIISVQRLERRIDGLVAELQQDIRPLVGDLKALSGDAARATSLIMTQVERADRVLTECTDRLDETMTLVEEAVVTPASEGRTLVDGLPAGLAASTHLLENSPSSGRGPEDDDALFIG